MAIAGDTYSLTTFANAFKQVFKNDDKVDIYHFENPLLARITQKDGFTGTNEEMVRATSFAGGYGFGTIPRSNESNLIRPRITAKKYYAQATLDVESIAAAKDDKGAFFDLVRRVKLDIKRSINNGLSLALLKSNIDNELVLGTIASGGVSGSDPYVLTLDSLHVQNFHIKQIVSIEDGNSDLFEVTAIDESAGTITVGRLTGSQVPAQTDEIFLQGGDGSAFSGLPGAVTQSGTLYNVTVGAGWQARNTAQGGAAVNEHMLYNELLRVKEKCGKMPNLIACGLTQYLKIKEFLSNKRELSDLSDAMGHKGGLVLMGDEGPVDVIWDRHIENDYIYFLNTDHMWLYKRPMEGIVEHGGDILLPMYMQGSDEYLIVYRCYGDFYIEPTYQAVFTGLAT